MRCTLQASPHAHAVRGEWTRARFASPQVTFSGRPGPGHHALAQGTTLDVAGRRDLLELPVAFGRTLVRLRDLQLVNLPYDAAPRDCRAFLQAQMHWIRMPVLETRWVACQCAL